MSLTSSQGRLKAVRTDRSHDWSTLSYALAPVKGAPSQTILTPKPQGPHLKTASHRNCLLPQRSHPHGTTQPVGVEWRPRAPHNGNLPLLSSLFFSFPPWRQPKQRHVTAGTHRGINLTRRPAGMPAACPATEDESSRTDTGNSPDCCR